MDIGTKYEVVKGGFVDPFRDKSGVKMKPGEIWDLVESKVTTPQLRKLNKNGSSTRLLNGIVFAACALDEERVRVLEPHDPKYIEHEALIKRVAQPLKPTTIRLCSEHKATT